MSRRDPSPSKRLESMIAALREDGHMTFRDIGREAGVSPASVHRFAMGEGKQPTYEAFNRIETLYHQRFKDRP